MIKKISILFVLIFSLTAVCYAENIYDIKLSYDNNLCRNNEIRIDEGRFKFEVTNKYENTKKVEVKVNFETADDNNYDFVLFNKTYCEKELKSLFSGKKLKFGDKYSGDKGTRKVKSSDIKELFYSEADNDEPIKTLELEEDGDGKEIKLYIYAVEHRTKRFLFWTSHKYNIVEEMDITFNVNVISPIVKDSLADGIIENYDNLINTIEETVFCNNPNHKPTLEKQKEEFQSQINKLKQQLDSIIEDSDYNDWTKEHYKELRKWMNHNMDSMELNIQDCEKHSKKREKKVSQGHRCEYCESSLKVIREELEKIEGSFYTATTEEKRTQLKRMVKTMYDCAKGHYDWGKNAAICDEIERTYKKIGK